MDPIANLRSQRELSREIIRLWDNCNDDGTLSAGRCLVVAEHANRLAELVIALDEWLTSGGFSPWKEVSGR